ncbi:alpha methylacyl-CoA racemase [Backusella circina FSU 941]|nr:alpha methylacyl-CoA racemase [Backusella circina FSU 941]
MYSQFETGDTKMGTYDKHNTRLLQKSNFIRGLVLPLQKQKMVYSIPEESKKLLQTAILDNDKLNIPSSIKRWADKVKFEGTGVPMIPINWRFAESISSLKGYEALVLLELLDKKYNDDSQTITINTDHAQLFIMSAVICSFKTESGDIPAITPSYFKTLSEVFSVKDSSESLNPYNVSVTNIYKTKDNKFYHLHGSMDASVTQKAIGLGSESPIESKDFDDIWPIYQKRISELNADELDDLINNQYGQAGTICYTSEEFKKTEHYKANAHVDLFETHHIDDATSASWWSQGGSVERPLEGLKVLDITRVIAAPTIGRTLAELGATVLRVTSPNLPDLHILNPDMNGNKYNCSLDFKNPDDLKKLHELIEEADVVIEGYRPYHLDKYGLGKDNLLAAAKKRGRGIVYIRENCYGWNGPWSGRTGWQQISDACCGVSWKFGQSVGVEEPITPVFPNSDFCTGTAGAIAVMQALIEKSQKGGSYVIDCALNYYSQWLVDKVGTYSDNMWKDLWENSGKPSPRYYYMMPRLLPMYLGALRKNAPSMWNPNFFELRPIAGTDTQFKTIKSVHQFDGKTKPGFDIPVRGNGRDPAEWPASS